ncbi:MAG: pyrimidine dimer DNA glycosylase/endonuclease V [Gammaproteobacteria bacterium]
MRLWSLHPKYLDAKGLVAVWREALLAQAVLQGKTWGYRNHPQLWRFKQCRDPAGSLTTYLWGILEEAQRRNYAFDATKLGKRKGRQRLTVTKGQLQYELRHLRKKLWVRDRRAYLQLKATVNPKPHPMFRVIIGGTETWEKALD